jgi:hypothetical protein
MRAYIERVNGRWEAWTWADGDRHLLGYDYDLPALVRKLKQEGYDRIVTILGNLDES